MGSARFLLAAIDGGGTVPPLLGLAGDLVGRGHEVRVLADPTVEESARSAGCAFTPWRTAPYFASTADQTEQIAAVQGGNPYRQLVAARDRLICGPAAAFADDVVSTVRAHPVDAVLSEGALPGILIGAEATHLPSNVHYVRRQLDDPAWARNQDWRPNGDGPLVLVAMSSIFQDQVDVLRRVATALGSLPVRGVITTGRAIDPDQVPAPANVRVLKAAPHREILAEASMVVTHAGHGSVLKALSAAVPLVCIPMGRDQRDNTARVRRLGAGVRVGRKPHRSGSARPSGRSWTTPPTPMPPAGSRARWPWRRRHAPSPPMRRKGC